MTLCLYLLIQLFPILVKANEKIKTITNSLKKFYLNLRTRRKNIIQHKESEFK